MLSTVFLITLIGLCSARRPPKEHNPIGIFMTDTAAKMFVISNEKPHFVPRFLRNATETVQNQFLEIVKDGSETPAAMNEKLQKWFSSQDPAIKAEFEKEGNTLRENDQKMFAEIQSTTSLTAPEKEALEKIKVIGAKTDRTVKQQFDEATAVLKGLSEEQQKQITDFINDAIHRLTPKHHGHGHGHGHNHGH